MAAREQPRQFSDAWRTVLLVGGFASLFGCIVYKLHGLQVEQGPRLVELAGKQRTRVWTLPAARGGFYDAGGAPLAVSMRTWSLTCDPDSMDDRLRACIEISRIAGLHRDWLRHHFESGKNGRTVCRGLSDDQAEEIRRLKLPGIFLHREFTRDYPGGGIAAHVLGFVHNDGAGGAGLEAELDQQMRGSPGRERLQIDALGKPVLSGGTLTERAVNGADAMLTIDLAIQQELDAALVEAAERHAPTRAAGVVVRPATGEILAMSSWPAFDQRNRTSFTPDQQRNNVLNFVYEPGSTMKPLIAGAAVADGLARWNESIFCENGRWTYSTGKASRTITDHSLKNGGHGNLTLVQGIALSDNILMAKLGLRLGPERLASWVDRFGFGARTGVPLPGEDKGIVNPKWDVLGACMSVPMGHQIAVTPMQLVMAHAMVANYGVWNPPKLIKRLWTTDDQGGQRDLPIPQLPPARRMLQASDAAQIQDAMTHTMTEGTGKGIALDGYISAGKTGTAEKLVNGRYSKTNHVGSFVCWAPAGRGERPEIICLVVIDDPTRNGHYGGETAGPVVQRVMQKALEEVLRVPKTGPPAKRKDQE